MKKQVRPMGTTMKNAHRQLPNSIAAAPIVGAAEVTVPLMADHVPMAVDRRCGSMVDMMMASEDGVSIAPPIACTTRAAMMSGTVGASATSAEPTVKSSRLERKTRLRPSRSAKRPAGINSAAATIVNDVNTP
jgi:hypothetical protein